MKSLLQKPAQLLAAFAVATLGMGAPAALANDTQSEPTTQNVAYGQQYASLSKEEAQALSAPQIDGGAGSVVLFVGEGMNERALGRIERQFERNNINIEVVTGGDRVGHMQVFVNNVELQQNGEPIYLDIDFADQNLYLILSDIIEANKINVFANADTQTIENEPA